MLDVFNRQMQNITNNSILAVYKPKGITSFDLIRIIRKNTDIKKIGHAGTLDPNAEGLMILGTGTSTKKLTGLVGLDKTYIAEIKLGTQTDSGDIDGAIESEELVNIIDASQVEEIIESFRGTYKLPVSLYSAIKKDGKPLYKYARAGEAVEKPVREMTIHSSRFISYNHPIITAEFSVSSGTYIRSIAEEIAKKLGTIGLLQNLKRTRIGEYSLDAAIRIDQEIINDFISKKKIRVNKKSA